MQLDTKPLIDAINRLIAKADDDLKDSLEAEGYVAATCKEYQQVRGCHRRCIGCRFFGVPGKD